MGKQKSHTAEQHDRIQLLTEQLRAWRDAQNELRKKIDAARKELRSLGVDPDFKFDLRPRNEKIYLDVKRGRTLAEVGEEFGLTSERIRTICKRVEKQLMLNKQMRDKEIVPAGERKK